LQELLDEEQQIQGEINDIDEGICQLESKQFEEGWREGNLKIGWTRNDIFSVPMETPIANRDRMFSLSSVTSWVGRNTENIDNEVISPYDKSRFHKK
jgi:hypothetical protein